MTQRKVAIDRLSYRTLLLTAAALAALIAVAPLPIQIPLIAVQVVVAFLAGRQWKVERAQR